MMRFCCIRFTGSHKSVFKESKVVCQAATGDARYPSGVSSSHCTSRALCSYRWGVIAAEREHRALHLAWKSSPGSHRDVLLASLQNM